MRGELGRLLTAVDEDDVTGPKLRAAHTPHRFCFTDFDMSLYVDGANDGVHSITWTFAGEPDCTPALTLDMSSADANRFLQGKFSLPIGLARGQVRLRCSKAR